jgi:two-component system chemotaxis response regulator CheY
MSVQKNVVIVDDSPVTSGQLVEFFKSKMGFNIAGVGVDGDAAIELYRTHKPDLITLDITMPNKDGKQATIEILSEFPDANIIMVSALRGDTILECLAAGAKGYFTKPIKINDSKMVSEMINTISAILEENQM